jgi:hypothetical protein
MGTGKTLVAIEAIEQSGLDDWLWVGPKSALAAVELEFYKWDAKFVPEFVTYDRLRRSVQDETCHVPQGIVFDESSKVKTPTAQRSQAAAILAEEMLERNPDCFTILMSGAPAPKSPADWWHQCEVACPGFLREGKHAKFKHRLSLIVEKESIQGGVYPELVTWYDDERKCKHCGKLPEEHYQDDLAPESHSFEGSVNEVALLYERMKGLVLVKFKKDCLDLPDMQYRVIKLEPSKSIERAAGLIVASTPRTVTALMLTRELSDGFQYEERKEGTETCPRCKGTKKTREFATEGDCGDSDGKEQYIESNDGPNYKEQEEDCPHCSGVGEVAKLVRVAKEVPCPKEQVLIDLLDEHEHEPIGRFVVYAGFQASVDRCVKISLRYQWDVIRVDGRGWSYFSSVDGKDLPLSNKGMLQKFQENKSGKIVFIGQPGAAGMGLTLTASPSIFFYSNSFNAEDRIQATDRIHRIGMDTNKGATIIDVVHLNIDQYILDNLKKKTDLLNMTMGKLREAVKEYSNGRQC